MGLLLKKRERPRAGPRAGAGPGAGPGPGPGAHAGAGAGARPQPHAQRLQQVRPARARRACASGPLPCQRAQSSAAGKRGLKSGEDSGL